MTTALIGFAVLLLLAFSGFPLGLAMLSVGFVGFSMIRGLAPGMEMVAQQILDLVLNYNFTVLPLFLLMGVFVNRAGLSDDLYDAAYAWLGHNRGGLALATIAACGGFAAVSGSSIATAATMAKVAIPSMRRFKYADSLAAGTVAAGGTMGILIPPSAALIVYGILTDEDIGQLFIAGIIPGILTVLLYMLVVYIVTHVWPHTGPRGERASWRTRLMLLGRVWAVLVLFLVILGGIYLGVFTPTEAGGIGAGGALIFAMLRRKMRWHQFVESLIEAGMTTAMVFTVAFGALVLNNFVIMSGLAYAMTEWIETLQVDPIVIVLAILAMYIALGTIIEGLAMIFLTVPIFFPIIQGLDLQAWGLGPELQMIWFGIVMVMVVEISLITPPIGLNVFVMKAMLPDVPLSQIFLGIAPFFVADIVRLLAVVFIPAIVVFLPGLMCTLC